MVHAPSTNTVSEYVGPAGCLLVWWWRGAKESGAIAKPDLIRFTHVLPKTRSGKIMRRLLRDIAAGKDSNQDTTTLEDASILAKLRGLDEEPSG